MGREGDMGRRSLPIHQKESLQDLKVFYGVIQMANYGPQKIGKIAACYYLAANDFKSRL